MRCLAAACVSSLLAISISCANPGKPKHADIVIATANLLWSNEKSAKEITESLVAQGADVLALNEADTLSNVDCALLRDHGYYTHYVDAGSLSGSILMACRIDGHREVFPVFYQKRNANAPFGIVRFKIKERFISVINVHLPAPFYNDLDMRDDGIDALDRLVNNGKISYDTCCMKAGDYAIVCGDFNLLPTDNRFKAIASSGLTDALIVADDKYSRTWGARGLEIARIDYIFVSDLLALQFCREFDVPGSDHDGVVAGVSLP